MALSLWGKLKRALEDEDVYLVVLDELTYVLNYKWLDKGELLSAIQIRRLIRALLSPAEVPNII